MASERRSRVVFCKDIDFGTVAGGVVAAAGKRFRAKMVLREDEAETIERIIIMAT